ncbi:GNAT family N-acetyltransferase [Zhengella sp. ZM62]|uniref:GNAT family N-acetyltransferase n=1 Tax=Zhengella sedimenti TaxID=3390035 RepID=UPI003975F83E
MVDVSGDAADLSALAARPAVQVETGPKAHEGHAAFCARVACGPAQHADWVAQWARHVNPDIVFITVAEGDRRHLCLPLEVIDEGLGRVAVPVGGRHANGCFPAMTPDAALPPPADLSAMMAEALRAARPDIALIALTRLQPEIGGLANPLVLPSSPASANLALAVDLAGGFDATLQRHSGKRKRKKHRTNERKFSEQGDIRVHAASDRETARRLLDAFFDLKSQRFASMGIEDVFANPAIKAFFHGLFGEAVVRAEPQFILHALEVGGEIRAVTGSSLSGKRMICEFSAIRPDEKENTSPGDYLFFEAIREACDKGFLIYDFSVGDEPYKRLWCDIETVQRDTLIPLNARGRLLAAMRTGTSSLKRQIKNTPPLWAAYKSLRKLRASRAEG